MPTPQKNKKTNKQNNTVTDALNSNPPFFLCLNTSFVLKNYQPRQYKGSYKRAFIVNWSLSGMMSSKFVDSDFMNDKYPYVIKQVSKRRILMKSSKKN